MIIGNALTGVARSIDRLNEFIGNTVSWLTLAVVLITCAVAVLRYGFGLGWVWLQESYVWLHGTIFTVCAAYTLLHDGHVRVDIFYRTASDRYRAWVNLLGAVFLLLPMVGVIWWVAWPYVTLSWSRLEQSSEAGGLHGLFLFKTAILVFCILLGLQGLSLLIRSVHVLRRKPDPDVSEHIQRRRI
ncbi:MAG TPA: C4-dicarboxylate ABC transporter permease [Hyphomonas atlantica]|uniref:TRAP transporter small permease protein n=1 Tax=Hyphomonas atlantica TaxID=1280948 RepID=A0A356W6Y1_9PROT|nr:C4-dicarboxylate ABC transporter permease [Magnetovibrio sp.]MAY65580.1 C4-dicarboxylate ABC transporter permease [Rhodospirillaceae bacterium]HBQ49420.1 C4-dicarboxylate ABC transporter permease [Hyphomonas atlantica]|tara:strand:+ start:642 stop:1199 length:558 start_codon:yes stop_codon:yes gene_type:complete